MVDSKISVAQMGTINGCIGPNLLLYLGHAAVPL